MAAKYFQIGFNKCGTTSLARFFNRNGIRCVHYDRGRLGRAMQRNLQEGRFILAGYEDYDAYAAMSYLTSSEDFDAGGHYEELFRQVPDAKFILNTRSRANWIESRLAHQGGDYLERTRALHHLADAAEAVALWEREWEARHLGVRRSLPAQRLLVFDIERDPAERLCEFVGLDAPAARHWSGENPTMSAFGEALRDLVPQPILAAVPRGVNRHVRRLLRRRP